VFAAINTAVDIAKKTAGKKPAGFVNAVLRAAAKGAPGVSFPDPKKDGAKFISIQYSLPLWLAKKWIQNFGFKATCSLGKQINVIPPITLRTNTLKTDRERLAGLLESRGKNIAFTPAAAQGICFTNPAMPVHEMEEFQLGLFQVQDEAAQIVTEFLAPEPGEKILDTCAGLGGKTGHMAQLMENRGIVVAADLDGRKLESLESEGERLGIDIIQTRQINLLTASINDFDGYFDRVLLDAPCTGLGVLGRNPDTRWKRSRKDIERLAGKQKKMMGTAANLVKPGGILVYAVCSCEREENEAVVQAFLSKRKDFSIDHSFDSDPSCRSTNRFASTQLISAGLLSGGCLKTYPAAANMDGFFAARFKRTLKST
jgi:16S rRNA (cytosine967-C5)-methyltransferase